MNQLSEQTLAIDQKENNAPRQVFLFSGHMVDASDRSPPRFPPDKEPLAAAAIDKLLDELGAVTTDVAISSGACGGDLLFAESCLQRRLRVEIYLPFLQEEFLKESINFAGEHWRQKFFWVKERVRCWHIMPQEIGAYAHERRSLCLRQLVDARSSARLRNQKSQFYLPVGSPSG